MIIMDATRFTVLGGRGFVGSALAAELRRRNIGCVVPERDWQPDGEALGHVIYCIGLTSDFRWRPIDTIEAHVSLLNRILASCDCDSLLYLSSTRVYAKAAATGEEAPLVVSPADPSDLYNLSKLTGEAICLNQPSPRIRVARLSNVVGFDTDSANFVTALIQAALTEGRILLNSAAGSEKDYILAKDVARMLIRMALDGQHRLYNLASGCNVSNGAIASAVAAATGCSWSVAEGAPMWSFPPIETGRLKDEFGFAPATVLDEVPSLVERFRTRA